MTVSPKNTHANSVNRSKGMLDATICHVDLAGRKSVSTVRPISEEWSGAVLCFADQKRPTVFFVPPREYGYVCPDDLQLREAPAGWWLPFSRVALLVSGRPHLECSCLPEKYLKVMDYCRHYAYVWMSVSKNMDGYLLRDHELQAITIPFKGNKGRHLFRLKNDPDFLAQHILKPKREAA